MILSDPQLGQAYATRGFIRQDQGDLARSVADFSSALERGDRRAEVLFARAVGFDGLGRHVEAIADCTSAIEVDPQHANAYNSRGLVRIRLGQLEEALADLNRAIELDPSSVMPYINRAQVAIQRQDPQAAIADYTHVIERPQSVDTQLLAKLYWNRGRCYLQLGDEARAKADCFEAVTRDPSLKG